MNIKDYWIEEVKNIKEFKALSEVEDAELGKINKAIQDLIDDQFIETATEKGIERRESILNILPFADDSLEERRFRILSRWNSKPPYTYRGLIEKLNQMCGEKGYTVKLNTNEYSLLIRIELTAKRMFEEVKLMSRKMVPANILISVELRYNQHKELRPFTHRMLSKYRHEELREEALKA